jgi:hypothetical protein
MDSIKFIEKQLVNIIKHSMSPNIFIISNIKFSHLEPDKIKAAQKLFSENDKWVKNLSERYDIKIYYIDLQYLKVFKNAISKFISLSFIKKGIYNNGSKSARNKKALKNSVSKNLCKKYDRKSLNIIKMDQNENDLFGTMYFFISS